MKKATPVVVVTHNIFLTKDQMSFLANDWYAFDTEGVNTPIWMRGDTTSEPGKEIFCKYRIENLEETLKIKVGQKSYLINIPFQECSYNFNRKNSCRLYHEGRITLNDEVIFMQHIVLIKSLEELEESIVNSNLTTIR